MGLCFMLIEVATMEIRSEMGLIERFNEVIYFYLCSAEDEIEIIIGKTYL